MQANMMTACKASVYITPFIPPAITYAAIINVKIRSDTLKSI